MAVSPLPGKEKSYFLLHAKKREREREREMKIIKETSGTRLNAPTVTT